MAKRVSMADRRLLPVLLALGMVLAMACGAASSLAGNTGGRVGNRAPEFQGIVHWINSEPLTLEELRHARETAGYEDYIALKFSATTVNAVVNPLVDVPFEVRVTIDGRPLSVQEAGPDVEVADGRSFFRVDEGRMYQVVALPEYGSHELRLSSQSDNFSLFAFAFGAYEQGP